MQAPVSSRNDFVFFLKSAALAPIPTLLSERMVVDLRNPDASVLMSVPPPEFEA